MGYTNYWKQPTPFTDAEWSRVCKEFNIMKDKWNGDLGKVWMDVATDTDRKEFGLWSFWNMQIWHSAMV